MQKQASEFQQAVQGPMKAFGQKVGDMGSGLQRSFEDVLDRTTQPVAQVCLLTSLQDLLIDSCGLYIGCEMSRTVQGSHHVPLLITKVLFQLPVLSCQCAGLPKEFRAEPSSKVQSIAVHFMWFVV